MVSVSSREECALTALAQPSGPWSTSTSRQEGEGISSFGTFGGGGVIFAGGRPTAPGCFGPFTTCTQIAVTYRGRQQDASRKPLSRTPRLWQRASLWTSTGDKGTQSYLEQWLQLEAHHVGQVRQQL